MRYCNLSNILKIIQIQCEQICFFSITLSEAIVRIVLYYAVQVVRKLILRRNGDSPLQFSHGNSPAQLVIIY